MIKRVRFNTGDDNEYPREGFCWTEEDDPVTDACLFCVLFGVPTWSVGATT